MIWLTWRQFRAQAWVTTAALAVIAVALAVTGLHLAHRYATSGIGTCQAHGDCGTLSTSFIDQLKAGAGTDNILFYLGIAILYVLPAIIGVFWGAPLVTREVEAGTFRLAWNQSVTRTRWLAVKVGLVGLAAMATAGLLSLMVSWWASPIDRALGLPAGRNGSRGLNRFTPLLFGARGITPIGYAAFAFVLGVTAGMLIRRTVPAMAATLAIFAAAIITMSFWIRPHLVTPLHAASALIPANIDELTSGAWPPADGRRSREHARCLGPFEPDHQPERPRVQRPGPRGLPEQHSLFPGVRNLTRPASPAAASDLPARQPLLGLPGV